MHQIDGELCNQYREKVRSGEKTIKQIADDSSFALNTVYKHVAGDCSHEVKEDPLERDERSSEMLITFDECYGLRKKAKEIKEKEEDLKQLEETVEIDFPSICHHIYGGCSCKVDAEPIERTITSEPVDSDECEQIREYYQERPSMHDVAETFDRDYKTIRYHIKGDCSHADEDITDYSRPLADYSVDEDNSDSDTYSRVSQSECEKARRMHKEGFTGEQISEEINRTWDTLRLHINGECKHDVDGRVLKIRTNIDHDERRSITEGECAYMNYLYNSEYMHMGQIMNKLDISKEKTVKHHLFGDCSHGQVELPEEYK